MRRTTLLRTLPLTLLLACGVDVAWGGGIDLTWGTGCYPETPQTLKTFACNSNTGSAVLTASFVPATDQPTFVGIQATLVFQIQSTVVPDWWQLWNTGACRQNALSVSEDFIAAPQAVCVDPWANLGAGGVTSYLTGNAAIPPSTAWLRVAFALASPVPLFRGIEYYGFRTVVLYAKTAGAGSCGGCGTPALAVLNSIRACQNSGSCEDETTPATNACVIWQSGSGCQATPAHNVTWAAVKSMYR
jgi:hypothetical protein